MCGLRAPAPPLFSVFCFCPPPAAPDPLGRPLTEKSKTLRHGEGGDGKGGARAGGVGAGRGADGGDEERYGGDREPVGGGHWEAEQRRGGGRRGRGEEKADRGRIGQQLLSPPVHHTQQHPSP